jgi:WD40-like Beta Propeller Repeat
MRIIRNFLILCVLMCGLLFAVRQVGAAMGKGDVLAYQACQGTCIPALLDMRTLISVGFNIKDVREMFWTENGHLYVLAKTGVSPYNLHQWDGGRLQHLGSFPVDNLSLMHKENNWVIFMFNTLTGWQLLVWDGAQVIEFTPPSGRNLPPVWAADGHFAFFSTNINNDTELYVSGGLALTSLGRFTANSDDLMWSADGRLALLSDRDGNREIYVWDGTTLTNISQHPAWDDSPAWSADGRLAFSSLRDGNYEIYVWDGTALTNVSQKTGHDTQPQWSKDGQLAFLAEDKNVYVWGKDGVRLAANSFGNPFQWVFQGQLLFRDGLYRHLWDDGVVVKLLTEDIIEYGDSGVAFTSNRYRADNQYELYVLDGQKIVATGLVGPWVELVADGTGGLLGRVCNSQGNCDLYHWQDGHIRQLTNTPHIIQYRPSFRP